MATELSVKWNGNIYKIINTYLKEHQKFSQEVCKPGDERKYWELLKDYRGQGFYLPKLGDDVDRAAILKNIDHFKKKLTFIDSLIKQLKELKDFPNFQLIHADLDKTVLKLLELKKKYAQEISPEQKARIKQHSRDLMRTLQVQFNTFLDRIFFLKSYNFPNDYLTYRENYEKYKDSNSTSDKKKANEIFFFRKIVEDGAYNPDHTYPDKYTRTALDTLYLNIQKQNDFISEEVRYDLEWIENSIEKLVLRGKAGQLARLGEWRDRTEQNIAFYKEISKVQNKKKAKFLIKKENEHSNDLKDFVYKKQAEVYEWWVKRSELSKALFAMETILVNEVGVIDGKHGLERQTVAKVVLNRYFDDFYNQLEADQQLVKYLNKDIETEKEKWLNVLFKVGEFSFTYHYIPAVEEIFCPDQSRRGIGIRRDNLKISLKAINEFTGDFKGFRYFSRVSMLGKINMASVWTEYEKLPEQVGYKSTNQAKLSRFFLADNYTYFYTFTDIKGLEYQAIRIDGEVYSMRWIKGKPIFFDYLNPHLFTYFSKKK